VADDQFGFAVSIDGNSAVAEAWGDDDIAASNGSGYVFTRTASVWTPLSTLIASDDAVNDQLGRSVAVSGDWVIAGAPNDDGAQPDSGSAFIFQIEGDGDGVAGTSDLCPNALPGLGIDCQGRPLRDMDGFCSVDGDDIQAIVGEMLGQ
jgi:hypothetical protein